MNATLTIPSVRYGAPLPSTAKLSRGLFTSVAVSHELLLDTRRCEAGLRVVLAPNVPESEDRYLAIMETQTQDILSGDFRARLGNDFIWTVTSSNASSSATSPNDGDAAASSANARSQVWADLIHPVLNGSVACNWSAIQLSNEWPDIRVDGYCKVIDPATDLQGSSACLLALLAYLASDPDTLYLEPYAVFSHSNLYAAPIIQSASTTSTPLWSAGLNGTGQVAQVTDTGVVSPPHLCERKVSASASGVVDLHEDVVG